MTELEQQLFIQAKASVAKSIAELFTGYHNPLTKVAAEVVEDHRAELKSLMDSGFVEVLNDPDLKQEIKQQIKRKAARILVDRMGGEIESQVNKLKADPATRAKITLAIDAIASRISVD